MRHSSGRRVRVAVGLGALAFAFAASLEWWSGMAYLAGLHGSLGQGVWPALIALWALPMTLLVPLGLWAAWPVLCAMLRSTASRLWVLGAVLLGIALAASSWRLARVNPSVAGEARIAEADLASALSRLGELGPRLPKAKRRAPELTSAGNVSCLKPPSDASVTIVATFVSRGSSSSERSCFQGQGLKATLSALRAALLKQAARGPLELEVVSGFQTLSGRHRWLDALKLRPGLDGLCDGGTCVMPWQLLGEGLFSTHRPVAFIPDLQFGASPERLRQAVGSATASGLEGLVRLTTRSYVIELGKAAPRLVPLARMRRRDVALSDSALAAAERDVEAYVLAAQMPDGRFRYTLDPLTGASDTVGFNLARQAGTTLVLCELGREAPEVQLAIERSLSSFEAFARRGDGFVALTSDPSNPLARIGESALPLVSWLACLERVGSVNMESIVGLARLILRLQREDGGFFPMLDLRDGKPVPGPEPLYAAGQAIMALVLIEQRQRRHPIAELPAYEVVHGAVERAMQYIATAYWAHPLADFFFLEENWHCLAARAALTVHRHAGYENFCSDYVRFKARLILSRDEGVDADFDGGFGFGNVIPPHNTGAAGFGEALAAAIALHRAEGKPTSAEERLLGRVMGFLQRQQWSRDNCFACASTQVIGGMSEHTHSAITRIDFAQHAWAALGHGRRVLSASLPTD